MSSVEDLRDFMKERLTAAAEEIFSVFKTTIVQYEQEIDRQRKLLDIVWKPEVKLQRIEIPQQSMCKEEEVVHTEPQLNNKDCNSSVTQKEPEPPQIKEEQEELFTSKEGEHETHSFLLTPTHEESDDCETKPESNHQPLSHNFHATKTQDQSAGKHGGSGSTRDALSKSKQREIETSGVKDLKWSRKSCNSHACEKRFKCETCGKTFKQKTAFRRHLRVHTGEKPYSCDTCGKRFSDASFLKPHMMIHTGEKPYTCKTCGKHFRFASAFKVHLRTHTGERPHSCSICKRSFYSTSHLKIHMRTHTGEKPYVCETCDKGFTSRSSLNLHIRRHTGEKPYPCKACGKRFCDTPALIKHFRIHTGEMPYTCKICGRAFRRSSGMVRHMKTHKSKKSCICKICGKRYTEMPTLKSHMEIHTDETQSPCKILNVSRASDWKGIKESTQMQISLSKK